jgi:dCTP deaminase
MPSILTDKIIAASVESGAIEISPYNPAQLNPTSYDLTLGNEVAVYEDWVETWDVTEDGRRLRSRNTPLDVKHVLRTKKFKIDSNLGWLLLPEIGYLMHTAERITTKKYVPVLDGKSSLGRLFVQIHATAGFGDVGYNGQYTLEVIVQHPIRVYPGMRIGQIRFHTLHGEVQHDYSETGHYKGAASMGAVASQAWKQFLK